MLNGSHYKFYVNQIKKYDEICFHIQLNLILPFPNPFYFQPNAQFPDPSAQDEHGAGPYGDNTAAGVSRRQRVPPQRGLPGHSGEWHLAGKPQLNRSKRKGKLMKLGHIHAMLHA